MLSATASARSRPLSLHSSSLAKRFRPLEARSFCASFVFIVSATTHYARRPLQTNFREWLERLRRPKFDDYIGRDGRTTKLFGVFLVARRPNPRFSPLARQVAVSQETVSNPQSIAAQYASALDQSVS